MPAKLSVNLNAVALLRNRRDLPWPSVEHIGRLALAAGAHGLTVHPRPDQRHIRDSDLPILRELIDSEFPDAELNIEGYPTDKFISLVLSNNPNQVTLVPDDPAQATSDHGWDFKQYSQLLKSVVDKLKSENVNHQKSNSNFQKSNGNYKASNGSYKESNVNCQKLNGTFRVSLFCNPDASEEELEIAANTGADRIEIYTQPYAKYINDESGRIKQLELISRTAQFARQQGLEVNAGHDLTVDNLPLLVEYIPDLAETSIGHGITADALEFGITGSVKRFLTALGW